MNMDACLPGHEARSSGSNSSYVARTGRENTRDETRSNEEEEEEEEAASRIKNAITILKNGPGNGQLWLH